MSIQIVSSKFIISSPNNELCPAHDYPEYVFIGRSNVGKSSLINAIASKKELAKTSAKPGKTQLINFFILESKEVASEGNENADKNDESSSDGGVDSSTKTRCLVDLPWYGYARIMREQREKWKKMIENYIIHRKNIAQVFVLIDSRIKPQTIDLEFVLWLAKTWKPYSLVFTKSDKVTQKEASIHIKLFQQELQKLLKQKSLPWHFVTSSLKPWTIQQLLRNIHVSVENPL